MELDNNQFKFFMNIQLKPIEDINAQGICYLNSQ